MMFCKSIPAQNFFLLQGMDSGFGGGEDESYNVYDKPWRSEKDIAGAIYRPSKSTMDDAYGNDLDNIIKTNRFVPHIGALAGWSRLE